MAWTFRERTFGTLMAGPALAIGLVLAVAACKPGADTGTLTPAHAVLFGCDGFATALDEINQPTVFNNLNDATVNLVVKTRDSVKPLCTGPAPDINKTVLDTSIDAGTRILQAVLASL